jgi:hypothetical protein
MTVTTVMAVGLMLVVLMAEEALESRRRLQPAESAQEV